jgi:hypothetical protein
MFVDMRHCSFGGSLDLENASSALLINSSAVQLQTFLQRSTNLAGPALALGLALARLASRDLGIWRAWLCFFNHPRNLTVFPAFSDGVNFHRVWLYV